jgi:hypothetical protein
MKPFRLVSAAVTALTALGCGQTVVIPIRGHGGATGIRLSVEGDLTGTAAAPGVPQRRLDEQITFPAPFWLCPASSVVWGRRAETTWNVMGCAPGADLVWSGSVGAGAKIEKVELDFGEPTASLYLLLYLDRDPWAISARIPMAAPTATSGTVAGLAIWESYAGGAEPREVGRSRLRLEWAFDEAVNREWTGTGRGH